ncbi:MAG: DMT family protein [Planctomycetes bacterium]|nr:DMT family protein [Planctomycetota bacterium]MBI3832751.1 DMT family protein [Planctomycetota bacterium]
MKKALTSIALLIASNSFMTTAWYWHLKHKGWTLAMAIMVSWLIALPEYLLQVPANRIGHINFGGPLTAPQLKVIQEGITLTVFAVFSHRVLGENLRWNDVLAFALIFAGVSVSLFTSHKA